MKRCLILHGPNLNTLGRREPALYGHHTLSDVNAFLLEAGKTLVVEVTTQQSNEEGVLITWVQEADQSYDGLIINGGGYSHTSVALHDALKAISIPIVEVHMTNLWKREPFRHTSLIGALAIGTIAGFGWRSYLYALRALADYWKEKNESA